MLENLREWPRTLSRGADILHALSDISPHAAQHLAKETQEDQMPEKETIERARRDQAEGKSPSTQAGEFVREEMDHIREGKHGARSTKQAIAIGLSKARRAGVKLAPPKKGRAKESTRESAERDYRKGQTHARKNTPRRISRIREEVLQREPRKAASRQALSRQAKAAARARGRASRQAAARKAVRTKGPRVLHAEARKAARTRQARRKAASI
jgi:Family of unknown function (DUF6496)